MSQLPSGCRICDDQRRTPYVISDRVANGPDFQIYSARRPFDNYRYANREFYEAAEDEWLHVLIRTTGENSESTTDDAQRLQYEMQEVLSPHADWFSQPLDFLPQIFIVDDNDQQTAANLAGLVYSHEFGQPYHEQWAAVGNAPLPAVTVCLSLLDLFQQLHDHDQVIGGISPGELIFDDVFRIACTASHRVRPIGSTATDFQLDELPDGFIDTQLKSGDVTPSPATDLYAWATLALFLLGQFDIAEQDNFDATQNDSIPKQVLTNAAETDFDHVAQLFPERRFDQPSQLIDAWIKCLAQCRSDDRAQRPQSVADLRNTPTVTQSAQPQRNLWKKWTSRD